MPIGFTKIHVMGNDAILAETFTQRVYDPETLSILLTDRTFGIGGEALLTVSPADGAEADASLAVWAADGTHTDPAGFAPFCAAKLLFDHRIVSSDTASVATGEGIFRFRQTVPDRRGVSLICGSFPRPKAAEPVTEGGLILHRVGDLTVLRTDESFPDCTGIGEINIAAVATALGALPGRKGEPFLIAEAGAGRTARAKLWIPGRGDVRIRLNAICAAAELLADCAPLTVSMTGGDARAELRDGTVEVTLPVTAVFDGMTVI